MIQVEWWFFHSLISLITFSDKKWCVFSSCLVFPTILLESSQENCDEQEYEYNGGTLRMSLWIVDYINPHKETSDCVIVEAESYDDAYEKAIGELKILKIPKRYILKMEEF